MHEFELQEFTGKESLLTGELAPSTGVAQPTVRPQFINRGLQQAFGHGMF